MPQGACAVGRAGSRRTVASLIGDRVRRNSPCTLRYPQAGFSRASRNTRSRMSWLVPGRPGWFGYVHLRVISWRCQASSVPGGRAGGRDQGWQQPATAARTAGSAQSSFGRAA